MTREELLRENQALLNKKKDLSVQMQLIASSEAPKETMQNQEPYPLSDQEQQFARAFDKAPLPPFMKPPMSGESLISMARGGSDLVRNQGRALQSSIPKFANMLGGNFEVPEYDPVKTGSGGAYEFGKFGAELPAAIVSDIGGFLPRAAKNTAYGAAMNPNSPILGGATGLAMSVIPETASLLGKKGMQAGKYTAEKIKGIPQTAKIYESIAKGYGESVDKSWGIVKPIFDKYGDTKLNRSIVQKIDGLMDNGEDVMTRKIEEARKNFRENPTLENLQKLQSKIAEDNRKLDLSQAPNQSAYNKREGWRDGMIEGIEGTVEHLEPGSAKIYQEFRPKYAENVGPYSSGKSVENVAKGKSFGVMPEDVYSDIAKGLQSGNIGSNHSLNKSAQELRKLNSSMSLAKKVPGLNWAADLVLNEKIAKELGRLASKADKVSKSGSTAAKAVVLSPSQKKE